MCLTLCAYTCRPRASTRSHNDIPYNKVFKVKLLSYFFFLLLVSSSLFLASFYCAKNSQALLLNSFKSELIGVKISDEDLCKVKQRAKTSGLVIWAATTFNRIADKTVMPPGVGLGVFQGGLLAQRYNPKEKMWPCIRENSLDLSLLDMQDIDKATCVFLRERLVSLGLRVRNLRLWSCIQLSYPSVAASCILSYLIKNIFFSLVSFKFQICKLWSSCKKTNKAWFSNTHDYRQCATAAWVWFL